MFKIDRFRSLLSLSGITIGVFTTLLVFTLVEGIERDIRCSLNTFGNRMVLIQTLPWAREDPDQDVPWWEYARRPPVTGSDADYLKTHLSEAEGVAYVQHFYRDVSSLRTVYRSAIITTAMPDWFVLFHAPLSQGRIFTPRECLAAARVAILGAAVAGELFPHGGAIGQSVRIGSQEVTVVGLLQRQGAAVMALVEMDRAVVIPESLANSLGAGQNGGYVAVLPKTTVTDAQFDAQLRSALRAKRRLSPMQPDNFSLNRLDFLQQAVTGLFQKIRLFGWVIGGFSLLIGCFGIANVLMVSVKERTPEIGLRKALGAAPWQIRLRFITEAAALSMLGAMLGIGLAAVLIVLFGDNDLLPLQLNGLSVLKCVGIALITGVLAGWFPARQAAALDPVRALSVK